MTKFHGTYLAIAAAALVCVGVGGGPASASGRTDNRTEQDRSAGAAAQPKAEQRRICVRAEPMSGSRMGRTICKTRAEWEAAGGLPDEN